ncbi:MAG: type I secretion system permease/ATPase [Sphingomonadales bacterium]|nr:type I secretion system permease/ATPase [Sphingomonadales bacterium]MBU3993694.1 type I secretion system permease/ATPase [Alphaproteobacteria bacterium]
MAAGPDPISGTPDSLRACIVQLADRFGVSCGPGQFDSLALDVRGRLPLHQAEAALELIGLDGHGRRAARMPRRPEIYPVILAVGGDGQCIVVHELRDGDALVWRPETGAATWEPLAALEAAYAGWFATVYGDPTVLRDAAQPWRAAARGHWFWSEVDKLRHRFGMVLLASVLINLLSLALPLFSMNVYDRVIPNRAQATLWVLAIGVLLAFALDYVLRRARTGVIDHLGRELDLKLSQKIFGKILAAPLSERKGHTGNLVARVSEYAIVRDFFTSTTIVLIVDMLFLFLFVLLIAWLAGWLALVPLFAMAVMALLGLRLQKRVERSALEAQADHGLQQTLLVESITGLETLKSVSAEGVMLGRWRTLAELGSRSQERLRDVSTTAIGAAATCQQACNVLLILGGYYLFDAGKITMGAIIAIVMLSARSLAPAAQLAFLLTRGQQAKQTLDALQELWVGEDERRKGAASMTPAIRAGEVRFENVSFAYPAAAQPALDAINLTIRPGDRVAIIGRVASGKSTLGRLLCGLHEPTGGAMLIDGLDSRQYRPRDIRAAFRFVGQDAALFSGTIKDNLMLGGGEAADDDLLAALEAVGAEQFLTRDEGGFDRSVGESGGRLSGGQRSFLTIARALVRPSRILFLDEPSGAMDSQSEKLLVERLSRFLTPQQTLVISTHRPALLAVCNRIIVLDKGRIVVDGPASEVLSRAGTEIGQ